MVPIRIIVGLGLWMLAQATGAAEIPGNLPPVPPSPVHLSDDAAPALGEGRPEALVRHQQGAFTVRGRCHVLGGGVRGFGVLARYPAPGVAAVRVWRSTARPASEAYRPDCLLRIEDPSGRVVAVQDLADQADGLILSCPAGPAGVWTVSIIGGRQNDAFELELPPTPSWGLRGEMSLVIGPTLPGTAFLWVPPGASRLLIEQFGGAPGAIVLRGPDGGVLASSGVSADTGKRLIARVDPAPAASTVAVDLTQAGGLALMVDGVPGLLCPTVLAAEDLRGGTVEAAGYRCAGPLQARIRAWMERQRPEDFVVPLALPAVPPVDLAAPQSEAQLFGSYGGLTGLRSLLDRQILDPANPWCGTDYVAGSGGQRARWDSGVNAGLLSPFLPQQLAALVATPARLNPLAGNPALARRAALAAFYHLSRMTGDRLLRDNNLFTGTISYPMVHGFFLFSALGGGLAQVQAWLDPEARELWAEGALALSDKLADHQGYQSNQWLHNLLGHLGVYRATGVARVRERFERQLRAFLAGAYGSDAKYGQHPAGYFLEEYGCDGNYDNMNLTAVVAILYEYRRLADHDPGLVEALRAAIERNLRFKSLLWMTDQGGALTTATAFNSRRPESNLAISNPAGDYLASREFPLAAARVAHVPMPVSGTFPASVFPYYASSDVWALRLIAERLPTCLDAKAFNGNSLLPLSYATFQQPLASAGILPFRAASGLWEAPGIVAWKRGGTYGVVFHDVSGTAPSRRFAGAVLGGGPTACWRDGGMLVASQASARKPASAGDVTFSCVYGRDARGGFASSGIGRSTLAWVEPGRAFRIRESLGAAGSLTWRYDLGDDGSIALSVDLSGSGWRDAWVNLPMIDAGAIWEVLPNAAIRSSGLSRVRLEAETPSVVLSEPLAGADKRPLRCVRVPISDGGPPVVLRLLPQP